MSLPPYKLVFMSEPLLLLASASPARTTLLNQVGIAHRTLPSNIDEEATLTAAGPLDPSASALLLARAKAEAVAQREESRESLVLGCDSIFEFEGQAYGKPHHPRKARERLRALSGKSGILHTGHWLLDTRVPHGSLAHRGLPGQGAIAHATVSFEELTPREIEMYVMTGEPLEVAGAFTLDGRGAAFIRSISGDPHAVVGLSVAILRQLLSSFQVDLTDLWNA